MTEALVVPNLTIKVVTGEALMDHGGGFSAIDASVVLGDEPVAQRLRESLRSNEVVTLRCARLDVVGRITQRQPEGAKTVFVLSVEDVKYRDVRPRPVVRRARERPS